MFFKAFLCGIRQASEPCSDALFYPELGLLGARRRRQDLLRRVAGGLPSARRELGGGARAESEAEQHLLVLPAQDLRDAYRFLKKCFFCRFFLLLMKNPAIRKIPKTENMQPRIQIEENQRKEQQGEKSTRKEQ